MHLIFSYWKVLMSSMRLEILATCLHSRDVLSCFQDCGLSVLHSVKDVMNDFIYDSDLSLCFVIFFVFLCHYFVSASRI